MSYNLDHNSIGGTSSDSLRQADFSGQLLQSVSKLDKAKVERLFFKYHIAIKTVLEVNCDLPEGFILYCVEKMDNQSRKISGMTLLEECEDLLAKLPENVLLQLINNIGNITVASLEVPRNSRMTQTKVTGSVNHAESSLGESREVGCIQSSYDVSTFKFQVNKTFNAADANNDVESIDCVDFVDSVHAQNRPVYEDEVDWISPSSLQHDQRFKPEFIDSKKPRVTHQNASFGLSSLELAPVKTQTETTPNFSFRGEESRSLSSKEFLTAVSKENTLLEMSVQCVLCKVRPRNITYLPCGHFVACALCSVDVFVCSVCDSRVLGEVATITATHIDRNP